MKLLFFNGSLKAGGAERSLSRLLNFLAEQGHEVHLALRVNIVQFELDNRITIHLLQNYRGINRAHTVLKLRNRLRSLITRLAPAKTCAYSSLAGVLLAMTFTKGTVVRFDTYPRALMRWKQTLFYTFFNLPHIEYIVCLTHTTKKDLVNLLPVNDMVVVPNASVSLTDEASIDRGAYALPTQRNYIVALGRLSGAKAYKDALAAYISSGVFEKLDFVFIGDGVELEALRQQAIEGGVMDRVHFLGHMEKPFSVLQGAQFLVHTSVREGFPNVLVEALSFNLPVIATDCKSGPSEIIQHGVNGYLVPVHDISAIGEKMVLLANNEDLRIQLAQNARPSISKFSEQEVYQKWLSLLSN